MGKDITKELTQEQKDKALQLLEQGMIRRDIAKAIHTRYCNLKAFLDTNKIPNKKYGIPNDFYEPIFILYESGLTLQQIHDNHYPQFSKDQINYICREKGITRKNGKMAKMNHSYFSVIDSNEKAYWLGLLFADGCVQYHPKKGDSWSIALSLMKEDKYLVENFAKAVETDLKVKEYHNGTGFQRKDGAPHIECRIVLYSSQMANDLKKYGIIPRKSLKVKELPNIEEPYMKHFIRGFFDGNGSITFNKCHGKDRYIIPKVVFYSTHEFCNDLNCYLNKALGVSQNKITDQKDYDVSFITYGKYGDAEEIYHYLYDDAPASIYMKRKKEKFEKYMSEYRDNHNI